IKRGTRARQVSVTVPACRPRGGSQAVGGFSSSCSSSSGDHPVLHSFPTRRSSDLSNENSGVCTPRTTRPLVLYFSAQPRKSTGRSEEHTSELQSRGHLVCRLLLEKKNIGNRLREPATGLRPTLPRRPVGAPPTSRP